MPLTVRGTQYPVPGEAGQQNLTGAEIDAIEAHFNVDGLALLALLAQDDEDANGKPRQRIPGYTRNRAIYSLVWLSMHRANPRITLDEVMAEYSIDELDLSSDAGNPTAAAVEVASEA